MYNNNSIEQIPKIGKIYNYDGYAGIIVSSDENYFFNNQDCKNNIKDGDLVSFYANTVKFGDEIVRVARFIEKKSIEKSDFNR